MWAVGGDVSRFVEIEIDYSSDNSTWNSLLTSTSASGSDFDSASLGSKVFYRARVKYDITEFTDYRKILADLWSQSWGTPVGNGNMGNSGKVSTGSSNGRDLVISSGANLNNTAFLYLSGATYVGLNYSIIRSKALQASLPAMTRNARIHPGFTLPGNVYGSSFSSSTALTSLETDGLPDLATHNWGIGASPLLPTGDWFQITCIELDGIF